MASWLSIACACSAAILLAGCGARHEAPPVMGTVPPFSLTDQNGSSFDSHTLEGKVWVADFIFTNCNRPRARG